MKKILFIIIAGLISFSVDAQKWYVATTGDDANGDGSITYPWKTVKHAADTITDANGFAGDTIVVGVGTFSELVQIALSDSISLMGAGETSVITSANALDPILLLQSTSEGTDGSQSISYLKFDGNSLTAVRGVAIWRRNNVIIHHCTFEDFLSQGASFRGQTNTIGGPTIYSTGNKFYNNIMINCTRYDSYGRGSLEIGGQEGMLVYNDTITVVDRGGTSHGYGIKGAAEGYNKGLKIYDNVITVPEYENTGYSFSMELWNCRGGVEIYDNILQGAIDIAGYGVNDEAGYGYAVKIYENTIGWNTSIAYTSTGIYIEPEAHGGIYIYRNYLKNMQYGVRLNAAVGDLVPGYEDIFIYYNIFYNMRTSGAGYTGFGLASYSAPVTGYSVSMDNIQFLNNVIYNPTLGTFNTGFWIAGQTPLSNIKVRNNIIYDAYTPVQFERTTIIDVNIDNNIFYDCTTGILYTTCSVTDSTANNNLTSDPLFTGTGTPPLNYKLQSGSPAKDAGISVGLTKDYGGYNVPVGPLPDIGAWEYGADVTPPNWHPTGLGWDDIYFKNNFRDTVNFTVPPTIAGAPLDLAALLPSGLTATVNDLNATAGATGNFQGQINSLDASNDAKADTSLSNLSSVAINSNLLPNAAGTIDLGSATLPYGNIYLDAAKIIFMDTDTAATRAYAREYGGSGTVVIADVRNEIADSLDKLRDDIKFNIDTIGIFVFGAGSGAEADSVLFEKGDKNFGSFYNYTDTLYIVNFNVLYLTSGDSLKFNCYWGNRMTSTKTDSLFNGPTGVGVNQNLLTPYTGHAKIPPDKDVWIEMSGTQITGKRPKQFELQLNGYTIRDH